jgi:hypothetical protein
MFYFILKTCYKNTNKTIISIKNIFKDWIKTKATNKIHKNTSKKQPSKLEQKIQNWEARIYPSPNGGGGNSDVSSDGWYFIEQDLDHFKPDGRKFNQVRLLL